MKIKDLFKTYEELNQKANEADEAWNSEPENEELEEAFDEAYEKEYEAFENLVTEIERLTNGMIDKQTAGVMVRSKREELKAIVERIA